MEFPDMPRGDDLLAVIVVIGAISAPIVSAIIGAALSHHLEKERERERR